MPKTISDISGDGATTPRVIFYLTLPDSGTALSLAGSIQAVGGAQVLLNPGSLTAPSPPAGGSITYWIIQCVPSSGLCSIKQVTVVGALDMTKMPLPDTGQVSLFGDQMANSDTNLANDPLPTTVDEA